MKWLKGCISLSLVLKLIWRWLLCLFESRLPPGRVGSPPCRFQGRHIIFFIIILLSASRVKIWLDLLWWTLGLHEVRITVEVVEWSIPNIGACMKLSARQLMGSSCTIRSGSTRLPSVSLIFVKYYPVGTVHELKPLPLLLLRGWLKCTPLASPRRWTILVIVNISRVAVFSLGLFLHGLTPRLSTVLTYH